MILFNSNKFYNDTGKVYVSNFFKSHFTKMKIEWSQFYLNQIIYTEEIRATACHMKFSPERHVFYLFQINFTTTRIQVCRWVPSNSFTTVEFDSVIILFESNNNWTRSIINCKDSVCSSSELNLRSPYLRFYLFQIKVQWKWIHLFTQSIPSLPNWHQFRNLYEFYLFQIKPVRRSPGSLGQMVKEQKSKNPPTLVL